MARPADRRAQARPTGERNLLDHVVGGLVDHVAERHARSDGWRFGPLVIVSADADAASGAIGAATAARGLALGTSAVFFRDGAALGREIAAGLDGDRLDRLADTLAACRLVVVDRIDRVGGAERQRSLVHLVDGSTAAGACWVVSLPLDPETNLLPQLASRLEGGLVVTAAPVAVGEPRRGPGPSLGRIIRAAARHHDVPPEAVLGPSRSRTVAAARSLAMYLARRLTDRSYTAIGGACGGRDHTTVLHGVRVCGARVARDPALAADVERLVAALSNQPSGPGGRRRTVDSVAASRGMRRRHHGRRRPA